MTDNKMHVYYITVSIKCIKKKTPRNTNKCISLNRAVAFHVYTPVHRQFRLTVSSRG